MLKIRTNLRKVVAIAICLAGFIVFSGCNKDDKEPLTYDEGVVINGVKWATRNVGKPGSFAAKPESTGMLYQWNSKVAWSATDLAEGVEITGWNKTWYGGYEIPSVDDKWQPTNDPCPVGWRVPTVEELQKLIEINSDWTTINGIMGLLFGSGENTIFIPASGARRHSGGQFESDPSGYWSISSVFDEYRASFLIFGDNENATISDAGMRGNAMCIRCVAK